MIHKTVSYQKRQKNGQTTKVSVRLSPAAYEALTALKAQFTSAYPEDQFPSLAVIFERALLDYAKDVQFKPKVLQQALAEMVEAGYPVNKSISNSEERK
jgi:hypothetical protein